MNEDINININNELYKNKIIKMKGILIMIIIINI